jgi:hypothetical protein
MTGSPGCRIRSQARNSPTGKVKGSATSTRARGSKAVAAGQPVNRQVSSDWRVPRRWTWARGPTWPAHRPMAGVSPERCPAATTEPVAHPTMARGWSTASTVFTMSSRAPAWVRVVVTTTRSGRSPMASSRAPAVSPVAMAGTGCSDRALAKGTAGQSPVGPAELNRMSSDRR